MEAEGEVGRMAENRGGMDLAKSAADLAVANTGSRQTSQKISKF